jgi:hypothetical protein
MPKAWGDKMRQRTISDYFWRDPKLCTLTQEDKATLLFFLTSPSSNIVGVYQVIWAIAGAEMGWTKDQLIGVAGRLRDRDLIDFTDDGWIFVKVWWEHNAAAGAFSPKLLKKAQEQLKAVPEQWVEEILELIDSLKINGINRVSIGYRYPIDTLSPNTTTNGIRNLITTTTTSGISPEIFYPKLAECERESIDKQICRFPWAEKQALLDELAGAIDKSKISQGVVGYMRGLVKAHTKGDFVPNLGLRVMEVREQKIKAIISSPARDTLLTLSSEEKLEEENKLGKKMPAFGRLVNKRKSENASGNSK